MIVACQWKRSSPTGPAEHCAGGSRFKSSNSFLILLRAILLNLLFCERFDLTEGSTTSKTTLLSNDND